MTRFRDRTAATALAALGGTLGLHRFYLEGAGGWRPWLYPAFAWTLVPTFAGFVEALAFAVTPDDRWDARWNAGTDRRNRSGALVVVLAVATLLGAATLFFTLVAFAAGRWSGARETFF